MKIKFDIRWQISDSNEQWDQRLLPLLANIEQAGSLQIAAKERGISYRTAWGIIRHWNDALGAPLCYMERGKGTKLSPLGKELIQTKNKIDSDHFAKLNETAKLFNQRLDALFHSKTKERILQAYTSHDLAISHLQSLCKASSLDVEFQSMGSIDSLKLLNSSQADIAGFHFPDGPLAETIAPKYLPLLNEDQHLLFQLATREQGLIINSPVKKHITSFQDITRHSLKFLNRQKGSGTRAIFDALITLHNINKKYIHGYEKEEFTHTAVAAMIASNQADVGFGLKAAAMQFNLAFLPLVTENYVIAIKKSLPKESIETLRFLMKDKKLKDKINKLPGYSTNLTGKRIHANKLLQI